MDCRLALDTEHSVHKGTVGMGLMVEQLQALLLKKVIYSLLNFSCNLKLGHLLIGIHLTNGSPVCLVGQLQIGLWLNTLHFAPIPQVPGQGSLHFWLLQASFSGHSEFVTHSGRQVGGLPM